MLAAGTWWSSASRIKSIDRGTRRGLHFPAVLIMPSERTPLYRLSRREKWMVAGVLGVVAALVVVLVISFVSSGPSSGNGCIYATIPGAVGAEQVHDCGATARQTCRSVNAPGAYTRQAAQTLAVQCRKAGLRVD